VIQLDEFHRLLGLRHVRGVSKLAGFEYRRREIDVSGTQSEILGHFQ